VLVEKMSLDMSQMSLDMSQKSLDMSQKSIDMKSQKNGNGNHLIAKGMNVWVPCPHQVWRAAEVIDILPDGIHINVDGRIEVIPSDTSVMIRNTDDFGEEGVMVIDDLTQLPHLHEPAILHAIKLRYEMDRIYTNTGPILIAVNPFKNITGLYSEDVLNEYLEYSSSNPRTEPMELQPHVYGIAANAYMGIVGPQHKRQMVLISGESGSGKTENTKFVLRLLTSTGNSVNSFNDIESLVLESNPLLESFGNSCTLRNHNSSRFGKFIELQYINDCGKYSLFGASIITYLLEKVRVTEQAEGERNFHIFYQYCAALEFADAEGNYTFPRFTSLAEFKRSNRSKRIDSKKTSKKEEKTVLPLIRLGKTTKYHYTNQSKKNKLKNVNDAREFEDTIFAMRAVGMETEEQTAIFRLIAAILLLGNTQFNAQKQDESEVLATQDFLACAAAFGVSPEKLSQALTFKTIITPHDRVRMPLRKEQATENRDSLARFVYGAIFRRLRDRINEAFGGESSQKTYDIGVLDIFGFECFEKNSFEQLCINFTNERLQQFFNNYVFTLEEELYQKEEIPWDSLDFPDNQDVIDLISGKLGVFALLDEECRMPKGTDMTFVNKLMREQGNCPRLAAEKMDTSTFIIKHFAGTVRYSSDCFLSKNKDQMSPDLVACVIACKDPYYQQLMQDFLDSMNPAGASGGEASGASRMSTTTRSSVMGGRAPNKGPGGSASVSVCLEFKNQLDSLIRKVDQSEPHFIRCVKPNFDCLPDDFDCLFVVEQLRYGGVLEVLRVQRAGYPVRLNHRECYEAYRVLLSRPRLSKGVATNAQEVTTQVATLLKDIDGKYKLPRTKSGLSFTLGKTLVFFKHDTYVILERVLYEFRSTFATKIGCAFRGYMRRKRFRDMITGAQRINRCLRGALARKRARVLRNERESVRQRQIREEKARQKKLEEEMEQKLKEEQERRAEEERQRNLEEERRAEEEQRQREEEERLRREAEERRNAVELEKLNQEKASLMEKLGQFEVEVVEQNNLHQKRLEEERLQQQAEMQKKIVDANLEFEKEIAERTAQHQEEVDRIAAEMKERERQREEAAIEAQRKHRLEVEERELKAAQEIQLLQDKQKEENEAAQREMQKAQLEFERQVAEKARLAQAMESESLKLEEQLRIAQEQNAAYSQRLAVQEQEFQRQLKQQETHYTQEQQLRKETTDAHVANMEQQIEEMQASHREQMETQKENYAQQLELQKKTAEQQLTAFESQHQEKTKFLEEQNEKYAQMFSQELAHKQDLLEQLTRENEDRRAMFDQKLQEDLNRIQELTEKTTEAASLARQVEFLEEKAQTAEQRGNVLHEKNMRKDMELTEMKLRNTKMNTTSVMQFTLGMAAALKWSRKSVDICVVGHPNSGKTHLCQSLLASEKCESYEPSGEPIHYVEFIPASRVGKIKILDCSGDVKQFPKVAEQFAKTHWVFCVYDACNLESIERAFAISDYAKNDANVLLFGNMFRHVHLEEPLAVDLETIRDRARDAYLLTLEGTSFQESAHMLLKLLENDPSEAEPRLSASRRPSRFSAIFDEATKKQLRPQRITSPTLLHPSVPAPSDNSERGIFLSHKWNPWAQERRSTQRNRSHAAVTAACFGREDKDPYYYLLAAGCREGNMAIFQIFRTRKEMELLDPAIRGDADIYDVSEEPHYKQILTWDAHDRAITSMMFTPQQDQIVTSSTDSSIRFWNATNGQLLQRFEDSAAISCVICLPSNPDVFVSGNANGVLRVGDTTKGAVLAKLKAPVEVRALTVDSTGTYVFCGTKRGLLLGLSCKSPQAMKFLPNLRLQLSQKGIGKITFVPRDGKRKPLLLVNSSDHSVSCVEVIYNEKDMCTNMQVLRRFRNVNTILPVTCCFATDISDEARERGFVITGSEDKKVYVWSLIGKGVYLTLEHNSPTLNVAVNKSETLIVSGDAGGEILLWRRQ